MSHPQGKPGTLEYLGVTPQPQSLTLLDLFAGAGGLSLGLHWAGFSSLAAVENDAVAADTYDVNFGARVLRDAGNARWQPRRWTSTASGAGWTC